MALPSLPTVGGDAGLWGAELNGLLQTMVLGLGVPTLGAVTVGTGGSAALISGSFAPSPTDRRGRCQYQAGSAAPGAGDLVQVLFSTTLPGVPIVQMTMVDGQTNLQPFVSAASAAGFTMAVRVAPVAGQVYRFDFTTTL